MHCPFWVGRGDSPKVVKGHGSTSSIWVLGLTTHLRFPWPCHFFVAERRQVLLYYHLQLVRRRPCPSSLLRTPRTPFSPSPPRLLRHLRGTPIPLFQPIPGPAGRSRLARAGQQPNNRDKAFHLLFRLLRPMWHVFLADGGEKEYGGWIELQLLTILSG